MTQHKATTTRLDIVGFKSFADEVHLDILPGLTGIVGPNGCGKSNIVEALRWTMGETSARALRGGESDDLIFAGTGNRPARNLARVTLHLKAATGLAPVPFQQADELEISRQAERGSGSTYRINNRVMRARDVQTIFADLSSGARSSSIISQNRVSQLIASKPEERRLLLEEAAGITGLYVRRRDAELKLRQAESNLERAEEHHQLLDQKLNILSAQSEQAQRYRTVSEEIRQHEKSLLVLQHARAEQLVQSRQAALGKAREALSKSEQALQTAQEHVTAQMKKRQKQEEELAALRPQMEQRRIRIEVAQASLKHRKQASEENARQRAQLEDDLARQKEELARLTEQQHTTEQFLEQLTAQQDVLAAQAPTLAKTLTALKKQEADQQTEHATLSAKYQDGTLQHERLQSHQQALSRQISDDRQNLERLQTELKTIEQDCLQNTPADSTHQQVSDSLEQAASYERHAKEATAHFQEQRLLCERTQRDLQDAQKQLQQLQQREKELSQSIIRQQARLKTAQEQAQQIGQELLDEATKEQLQQTCTKMQEQTEQATQTEKQLTQKRENAEHTWLTEKAAQEKQQQRRLFLQQELVRLADQIKEQQARHTKAQTALEEARSKALTDEELQTAQTNLENLTEQVKKRSESLVQIEEQHTALLKKEQDTQADLQQTETALLRCKGEHEGLQRSLQSSLLSIPHPVMERLTIPDELTNAVVSALTDGLEASLPRRGETLTNTPRQWYALPPFTEQTEPHSALASLPNLATLIETPAPLERAFQAIFLLENNETGPSLQKHLQPGQSLVSKDGALWRWDGFIRQSNTPTAEMIRLQQAQKLKKTEAALETLSQQYESQKRHAHEIQQKRESLEQALAEQRQNHEVSRDKQAQLHHQLEGLKQRHAFQQEQLTLLQGEATTHAEQLARTTGQHDETRKELATLPESDNRVSEAATILQTLREQEQAARQALDSARAQLQKAEADQQQALFRNHSLATRLEELTQAIAQLEQDMKEQNIQKQTILDSQQQINLSALQADMAKAQSALQLAQKAATDAAQKADTIRKQATTQEQAFQEQTRLLAGLQARRDSLSQQIQALKAMLENRLNEESRCQKDQSQLPNTTSLKEKLDQATTQLARTRETLQQEQAKNNALTQKCSLLKERHEHLQADNRKQSERHDQLQVLIEDLTGRHATLLKASSVQTDESDVSQHEKQLQQDMEALRKLEADGQTLATQLSHITAALQEQQTLLEHHKESNSRYREDAIRLKERAEQAEETLSLLRHDAPLPEEAEVPESVSAEAEQVLCQSLKRAIRRREEMGPVNLCAEEEFQTARQEAERIAKEHQDLSAAIARLRGGVGAINREGRQRLMAVFADINAHFQKLFTRMFNGGKAHLQMVGNDDPLEAGLEIFAQPPGKKLSTLSLLSGGEQALTALSLIFAAFQCTPAPICVLDEVDAPLDDANVERFCTLIRDITKETGTRFLVITHHQLTMAHMDRLYGVTMQERGVSRLLSVNLDESIRMVNG
ncbi:AAA family ATPase [Bombella sp. TMW 2.2559]|uniref:Chromosome partition protein Smc n=1 Tax=Bombella dulcis TaxID=2967339 RepID=A0ABT3W9Q8_9PROT|nr:AAA family ATPase [Bombella dulcis]MCX5615820.1 AAA family ATPase [Bombella dulcis]